MEGRESEVKWKRKKIEINNRQGKTILIVPFRDRLSVIGEGEILARAEVHFARFYFFNCNELFLHEYLRFFKKICFLPSHLPASGAFDLGLGDLPLLDGTAQRKRL